MECNRDEAIRAREIAENKFEANDLDGAVKFALKAKNIYPNLEGIDQLISTFNVYTTARTLINTEKDYYGIIGVDASADEAMVKKQFKDMARLIHPDKNHFCGAEGAFKLISEAKDVLLDRNKRLDYDHKRNAASNKRSSKSSTTPAAPTSHSTTTSFSFWTLCSHCNMKYEYRLCYLEKILTCPKCRQTFMAANCEPPTLNDQTEKKCKKRKTTTDGKDDIVGGHFFTTKKDQAAKQKKKYVKDSNCIDAKEKHTRKIRKDIGEFKSNVGSEGKHTNVDESKYAAVPNVEERKSNVGSKGKYASIDHEIKYVSGITTPSTSDVELESIGIIHGKIRSIITTKELCHTNFQSMLIENGKLIIIKELERLKQKQSSSDIDDCVNKEDKIGIHVPIKNINSVDPTLQVPWLGVSSSPPCHCDRTTNKNVKDPKLFVVPDADFHDFDNDRTEKDFERNQVWAIYDEEDGMPRYYVKILKILSIKPFQIRINYLNSKGNSEFNESLDWKFPKSCGNFKVGGHTTVDKINIFSHRLNLDNETVRGSLTIFPKKGEIWALYRNWSSDWDEYTEDDVVYRYDMVEVVDDYNEEQGRIIVCSLVKVDGFKTVFRLQEHNSDGKVPKTIPREEMFRFSHRVPSYVLSGEEAHNAPKGYYELDPASTPPELLQVVNR